MSKFNALWLELSDFVYYYYHYFRKFFFFNHLTPGSGNVAVNELHIGGSEGDDAIGVEDVARVDGHDDAQYRHQNTETAETHNFHR